ncbi:hypothetical protein E2C01_089326 [Portunus trituberculatus]|uniref:Transmembrane protein n=1 Tax=Portunus trituberculatus TaxID=210409 RepID=A0A5B7JBM0_PORTR|nr:hypothetical protein [Portunus trituberculatus]
MPWKYCGVDWTGLERYQGAGVISRGDWGGSARLGTWQYCSISINFALVFLVCAFVSRVHDARGSNWPPPLLCPCQKHPLACSAILKCPALSCRILPFFFQCVVFSSVFYLILSFFGVSSCPIL